MFNLAAYWIVMRTFSLEAFGGPAISASLSGVINGS
jgi:hypothetical protein